MVSGAKRLGAVYDELSTQPAVAAILERCGFTVALLRGPASELTAQVRALSPVLLVLDLASAGGRGLGLVKNLRTAVPACEIIPLAPFDGLREAALAKGAYDLACKDDLRDLERCLRRLTSEFDARESGAFGLS